ncbi:SUMF1/EgtB/PvdO family nonheme iron enzyme [Streptomyces sp. NBC_01477]|uniref:SUMF1/EgtB/PvdO family nonheme iron enzyme n=1 Tax=Streptomyces sp. NBC_01477 TaxID=2976015 RepID=UPI002E30D438|nr:SUMF1/EgtB/PvdO family nonheme iron enzyme [Streptomyces sp. NBC_01477]
MSVNAFAHARALVVGVEKYAAGPDWTLTGPAADARRFTDWLLAMGTPPGHVSLFANSATASATDDWRRRTGVEVAEPTSDAVHAVLLDVVREHACDVFFLFWGGHGITDPEGHLRLFTSDAREEVLRNVDMDDLMLALRSSSFARVKRQILLVDACRRYVSHRELRRGLPTVSVPKGDLVQTDQFALCATREGELAANLTAAGTGRLSSVLLRELPVTPGTLPDMELVAQRVGAEFDRLRASGSTTQVPVFYSSRGYDGSLRSNQLAPWATPAAAAPAADERQYVQRLARTLESRLVGEVRVSGMGPSFDSLERSSVVTRAQVRSTAISAEHTLVPDVIGYTRRTRIRRMIVTGAPGIGKSVLLDLLALAQCRAYQVDRSTVPVLAVIGGRGGPESAFAGIEQILRDRAGFLDGSALDDVLHRCVFYLDDFDELTPEHQRMVLDFMRAHPNASITLSTRSTRGLDWSVPNCVEVELLPLDPPEVLRQLECELGTEDAEELFWQLAGHDYEVVRDSWSLAGGDREQLWSLSARVPRRVPGEVAALRLRLLRDPPAALQLARIPFLLRAMVTIRRTGEYLDLSRPDVLDHLVTSLWSRPHAEAGYHDLTLDRLFAGLGPLAEHLIRVRQDRQDLASATALLTGAGEPSAARLIEAAVMAGLVDQDSSGITFRHRVIRDYFAAAALAARIPDGIAVADYIDPAAWWTESPWRAALGFVPQFHGTPGPVVGWLGEAQPELAAMCVQRGESSDDTARRTLRGVIRARLAGTPVRPPAELAALGRALAMVGDDRPGVGVGHTTAAAVPVIEWVLVPQQRVPVSGSAAVAVPAFFMSRYPVTNAQYEVFLRDGGYRSDGHWTRDGIACRNRLGWCAPEQYGPPFDLPNHPIVGVSYHEARAFGDWLGSLRRERVAIPTVTQWMAAARSADGFDGYPWGDDFSTTRSNSRQTDIRTTTAVGLFASGASHFGLLDCGGNVWELCAPDPGPRGAAWRGGFRGKSPADRYLPIKGGSFAHYWCSVKTRTDVTVRETDREWDVGFRLMKQL